MSHPLKNTILVNIPVKTFRLRQFKDILWHIKKTNTVFLSVEYQVNSQSVEVKEAEIPHEADAFYVCVSWKSQNQHFENL